MSKHIKMTWDEWAEKFRPITDSDGAYIDFTGDERVLEAGKQNKLWTVIDGDDYLCIINNGHTVNQLNYYITEVPFDPECTYEVADQDDIDWAKTEDAYSTIEQGIDELIEECYKSSDFHDDRKRFRDSLRLIYNKLQETR